MYFCGEFLPAHILVWNNLFKYLVFLLNKINITLIVLKINEKYKVKKNKMIHFYFIYSKQNLKPIAIYNNTIKYT